MNQSLFYLSLVSLLLRHSLSTLLILPTNEEYCITNLEIDHNENKFRVKLFATSALKDEKVGISLFSQKYPTDKTKEGKSGYGPLTLVKQAFLTYEVQDLELQHTFEDDSSYKLCFLSSEEDNKHVYFEFPEMMAKNVGSKSDLGEGADSIYLLSQEIAEASNAIKETVSKTMIYDGGKQG